LKKPDIFKEEGRPMVKRINKTGMEVKGKVVAIGIDIHKRSRHATAIVEGVIVLG
jgi:hypothetical protein